MVITIERQLPGPFAISLSPTKEFHSHLHFYLHLCGLYVSPGCCLSEIVRIAIHSIFRSNRQLPLGLDRHIRAAAVHYAVDLAIHCER